MPEITIQWKRQCPHTSEPIFVPLKQHWMLYESGEGKGHIKNFQQPLCQECGVLFQLSEKFSLSEG